MAASTGTPATSAQSLLAVAQAQGRALYLFDTFDGIPFKDHGDHRNVGDFRDVELDALRAALTGAVFCVGLFPDTLVDTGPLAFVHADADQYRSTRDICLHLGPRMVPGGLMLFDDYPHLESCRRAVDECFTRRELLADGRALVRF